MSLAHVSVTGSDPQLQALFAPNATVPRRVRERASFFVFFARTIYPQLATHRAELEQMYTADNGRPPYDPVRLLAAQLLQTSARTGDQQAAEAMQYDRRWRFALHLQAHENACDPSLFPRFRQRLVQHGLSALAFTASIELLVAGGWLPPGGAQRVDSTHVHGVLARLTRLGCVRATIRLFLQELRTPDGLPAAGAGWWQRYGVDKVDARSTVAQLQALSLQAGTDLAQLLAWANGVALPDKARARLALLRRVFEENYEPDSPGGYRPRHAQPPGAVHTPHEPEAEWSCKNTLKDKSWVGSKVTLAETVAPRPRVRGEPTCCFLTAIVTQRATASDKAGLREALDQQQTRGLRPPGTLYVDGAYVSGEGLHAAQCAGRELLGPAPASPDRGHGYTAEHFDVHVEERCARCPAGHRSTNCSRLQEAATGKVTYRLEWNREVCTPCPQFAQCVSGHQPHRTLVVGEHHTLLQQRRRDMQSAAFQEQMRQRNAIEGTGSELVRGYGLRQARHRGLAKVGQHNDFIGAACNFHRLARRLLWEWRHGLRPDLAPVCLPSTHAPSTQTERPAPAHPQPVTPPVWAPSGA